MRQTLTLSVPRELTRASLAKAKEDGVVLSHVVQGWLRSWLSGALSAPSSRQLPLLPPHGDAEAVREFVEGELVSVRARFLELERDLARLEAIRKTLEEAENGEARAP